MSAMAASNSELLKRWTVENGVSKYGVAAIDEDLKSYFNLSPAEEQNYPYAISLSVRLSRAVFDSLTDHPTELYKWHYRQANARLDQLAFSLTIFIQNQGYRALPIPASQIIDWQNQTAHLSHRHVAVAAGLGWIGRNNLLVTAEYGSQVRLVTVLTDWQLQTNQVQPFGCGTCYDCLSACPVAAIGKSAAKWDYEKCYVLLDYFVRKLQIGVHICGLCVKACPGLNNKKM